MKLKAMNIYAKNQLSSPENPILIIKRFNGLQSYSIKRAEWNLYHDAENGMNLWISISTDKSIKQQQDTRILHAQPNWELNLVDISLSEESIIPGFTATISESFDESKGGWISNFYYCEHEGSDRNTIEVIEVDGDRVRFRLFGETVDINYYDGSKPTAKLTTDIWFDRNRDGARSMS
jgi:hypothetical protein